MSKNANAVALGKLGGRVGGLARAKSLSPSRRLEIALKAAKAAGRVHRAKAIARRSNGGSK